MTSEIDPRDIFLKGKYVVLKVLTRDDVIDSGWYGWFNDEELCKTLQKHYFPSTIESQLEFWEKNIRSANDKIQLGICCIKGGPIVGVVSLNNIDFINRRAEFSAVIGERDAHNVKLFTESCKLLFNHGFYSLNLNRIYGGSISKDLVLMMCRMFNCKEEGVRRQEIYKNGKYSDSYCYGLLREDFPQLSDSKKTDK
jgi:RimJ/RimL family protein N-acetyltransferase